MKKLKLIDLTKVLKPFKSGWVALSEDRKKVIAHGESINEVDKKAKKTGENYIFHKVVPRGAVLLPTLFRKVK